MKNKEKVVMRATATGETFTVIGLRKALRMTNGSYGKTSSRLEIVSVNDVLVPVVATPTPLGANVSYAIQAWPAR